ncbi:hypothetical protein OYT1_ch0602 [Ferriphaselus amnicola]|uniref:Uncharacterized protein n=1 Tax=Ferriphaselus amnicola TaxID=1188319 RepID=A0A2Z6G9Z9_9PROT|nr:hypothetical protein OYT1_ch0602 [Ferriphaselus amnicola]
MGTVLTLSFSGLPDNDRLVLSALFTLAEVQLSSKWRLNSGGDSDAVLMANSDGASLLLMRPGNSAASINPNLLQLKRPFQHIDFIKALNAAASALANQASLSGSLAASLVQLRNDLAHSEAVWSLGLPEANDRLWVCTKRNSYWLDGGDNLLTKLDQEISHLEWRQEPREQLQRLQSEREAQPLFRLYWISGMLSGRGKLLPWLDVATPWKLKTWPSFFKLPHYPTFPRMAAAAMKQPMTLDDLIAFCGGNRAAAIEFVNASVMAEFLIGATSAQVSSGAAAAAEAKPAKLGLISLIRRKLGLL